MEIQTAISRFTDLELTLLATLLSFLIAVVFFVLGIRAKKPKLSPTGSGSSLAQTSSQNMYISSMHFSNTPTFLGMKCNRGDAIIDHARIYDPSLREYVGHTLLWSIKGSFALTRNCTIKPGTNETVYLFAKERHNREYFIYAADDLKSEPYNPTNRYKDNRKDFEIHLFDNIGRTYKYKFIAANQDQSVNIKPSLTLHIRLVILRKGFSQIFRAFSIRG